jgi:hypothetical protein
VRSREWEVGCREKRKAFFFKKKAAPALREAKNFCSCGGPGGARYGPISKRLRGSKSFLVLFFKKELLS